MNTNEIKVNEGNKLFLVLGSRDGNSFIKIFRSTSVKDCAWMFRGNGYKVLFVRELKRLRRFINKNRYNNSLEIYGETISYINDAFENKDIEKLSIFLTDSQPITIDELI